MSGKNILHPALVIAAFVVGIVVGTLSSLLSAQSSFVRVDQYREDVRRIESQLNRVEDKIDNLVGRGSQ